MVNLPADSELLSDLRWECGHRPKSWRSHSQYSVESLRFTTNLVKGPKVTTQVVGILYIQR